LWFDCPAASAAPLRQHGDLFWSDFWWNAWINSTIYDIMADMKKPPWENKPDFRLVDSGQILFDRMRHAEVRARCAQITVVENCSLKGKGGTSVWMLLLEG
jgi:hypothetical protein